jgi:hypothetical protein
LIRKNWSSSSWRESIPLVVQDVAKHARDADVAILSFAVNMVPPRFVDVICAIWFLGSAFFLIKFPAPSYRLLLLGLTPTPTQLKLTKFIGYVIPIFWLLISTGSCRITKFRLRHYPPKRLLDKSFVMLYFGIWRSCRQFRPLVSEVPTPRRDFSLSGTLEFLDFFLIPP